MQWISFSQPGNVLRNSHSRTGNSLLPPTLVFCFLLFAGCQEMIEQEARDKLEKAHSALQEERWEEANELFYEATALDPYSPDAWAGRGMALKRLDEPEAAREHYEEALHLLEKRLAEDPEDQAALHKKVMILVLLNDSDRARAIAADAREAHPAEPFYQNLPELIDGIERQFAEEILPREEL